MFPGCGKATSKELYLNPDKLQEKLAGPLIDQRYQLNLKLVDFRNIPTHITDEILKYYPSYVVTPPIKKKIILKKHLID